MNIVIFGGTGLLGADIKKVCEKDFFVTALSSSDVDVTDAEKVHEYISNNNPDVVINSAAMTNVDECEKDPDKAYLINAIGAKNIAMACRDAKKKMIHISTDYVFDGKKGEPYTEFDKTNPINHYGRSKLAGEEFVQMILNDFMILRTAWIFGEKRNHFVDYVVNSINNGEEIIAVKDMMSSPTYSVDLAEQIKILLTLNQTGIFHTANKGYCSRVSMVEEIMKIMRKTGNLRVVNQSQWEKPAKRPEFSALKNYHLGLIDADHMAGWRDSLKRYIKYKFSA